MSTWGSSLTERLLVCARTSALRNGALDRSCLDPPGTGLWSIPDGDARYGSKRGISVGACSCRSTSGLNKFSFAGTGTREPFSGPWLSSPPNDCLDDELLLAGLRRLSAAEAAASRALGVEEFIGVGRATVADPSGDCATLFSAVVSLGSGAPVGWSFGRW